MHELAMAIKWSSDAKIDLLTIDGAGGGTGMSPWRMMSEWGIPTFYLEAMTYELCSMLAAKGAYVPDIAIAGGFSTEDHIFKAIAMGAPFVKAVCMGRALMIPGMVGKNIGEWLKEGKLPKTVAQYGNTVEEIFVNYEILRARYGDEVKEMPLGAIAFYSFADQLRVGLQQLMAGSRNFRVSTISHDDLIALTEEAAKVSGIPYVMDAYRKEAMLIINGLDEAKITINGLELRSETWLQSTTASPRSLPVSRSHRSSGTLQAPARPAGAWLLTLFRFRGKIVNITNRCNYSPAPVGCACRITPALLGKLTSHTAQASVLDRVNSYPPTT